MLVIQDLCINWYISAKIKNYLVTMGFYISVVPPQSIQWLKLFEAGFQRHDMGQCMTLNISFSFYPNSQNQYLGLNFLFFIQIIPSSIVYFAYFYV